jgi:hypothetical protein
MALQGKRSIILKLFTFIARHGLPPFKQKSDHGHPEGCLANCALQPMAADDVATAVARIAVGVLVNGTVEVVGPRTARPAHAPEVVGESGDRPEIGDRKLLGIDLGP